VTKPTVGQIGGWGPLVNAYLDTVDSGNVARFLRRAAAGETLKISGLGDSIIEGTTGVTPGVDDMLTLVKNTLASRFPTATFSTTNRAVSGYTTATSAINGKMDLLYTDKPDLVIVGFGRNDVVADAYGVPVQGYPLERSLRGFEVFLRQLRSKVPQADVIVVSCNPASVYSGDGNMRTYQSAVQRLAAAYGCQWVDTYGAFYAKGDYSSYMYDTVHPNAAGHQLYADTILGHLPATGTHKLALAPGAGPVGGVRAVSDVKETEGFNGWRVVQNTDAVQDGVWVNVGAWSGSNPYQTTTATDYAEFTFVGTEFMARFSTSSGDAAVVDIVVDGVTTFTDLALSTVPSNFQPFVLLASGLTLFQHKVKIVLKSGTLKVYQAAWLVANIPDGPVPAPRKLISGRYYRPVPYTPVTIAPAAGTATVVPFYVPQLRSLDQLAIDVTTLAGGSTITLGIYGSDEFGQPLGLILDAGTVDSSTTGFKTKSVSRALTPGWYWLASMPLGGTPTVRANNSSDASGLVTTSAGSTAAALNGYLATSLSALPARWTSTTAGASSPIVLARFV